MSTVASTRTLIQEEINWVAGRIADMVREVPASSIHVESSDWTVADSLAHMAIIKGLVARLFSGEEDLRYGEGLHTLARTNAEHLAEFTERDPRRLADLLVANTHAFTEAASTQPDSKLFEMPIGRVNTEITLSYMLIHLMQHGSAIAKVLRKPYPVRSQSVELTMPFLRCAMPLFVDREAAGDLTACFDIRLLGGSRFCIRFEKGEARIESPTCRRADCHILAEPMAFFLVAMGIVSQWSLIPKGKLLTWGRKPWLAVRLPALFEIP